MPKPFFSFSIFNTVIMQHAKLKFKNLHKQFPSSYPPGFSSGSVTVSQTFQSVCLSTYSSSFEMNRTKICLDVQNKKGFTNPSDCLGLWLLGETEIVSLSLCCVVERFLTMQIGEHSVAGFISYL